MASLRKQINVFTKNVAQCIEQVDAPVLVLPPTVILNSINTFGVPFVVRKQYNLWVVQATAPPLGRVSYFISGISWTPSYQLTLDDDSIKGFMLMRLNNELESPIMDASVSLIIGTPNLPSPPSRSYYMPYAASASLKKGGSAVANYDDGGGSGDDVVGMTEYQAFQWSEGEPVMEGETISSGLELEMDSVFPLVYYVQPTGEDSNVVYFGTSFKCESTYLPAGTAWVSSPQGNLTGTFKMHPTRAGERVWAVLGNPNDFSVTTHVATRVLPLYNKENQVVSTQYSIDIDVTANDGIDSAMVVLQTSYDPMGELEMIETKNVKSPTIIDGKRSWILTRSKGSVTFIVRQHEQSHR